ncbi:hypothetical protein M406DRAFT_250626 [Cryphonectria parasitica EP155]|uniref:Single-strand DNA deaminase toxin A-like C-terminal domain-containing protein n=1 Tax=Cryphonectria parasitica (strain ATCC 38755 / EP155) TaxID=660469 RepID=A0A9P4Y8P9_CRYP1|nr:uncharacterized protein M406DRAFT_250626 [Cryphonectria parasitica EP155]KAF3768505.1 hypothetical protein M406DRAFT_250626 [Cryphonectria parasitica EP155]
MTHQLNSASPLRRAKVEWWNKSDVFVRCPNCEEIHLHHFNRLYETPLQRRSHCVIPGRENDSCDYRIIFPFDEVSGHAGYEIDKQRAIFVSGTADPTEYYRAREDDHVGPTVDDFRDRKKWTEATEKVHISEADSGLPGGYTIERIIDVVSALVQGRVGEVRNYLESSKDADILLHGVEAHSVPQLDGSDSYSDGSTDGTKSLDDEIVQVTGNTALHFAACEASYEMVRLLLQKGANPDAVNMDGRVPLMEAALWGRLRNVELLLEYGANKQIDCTCHGQRLRAVDFARPLRNNSKERYCRTGGFYKEDAYQRDLDREKIVRLLSESLEERLPILSSFAFTRSPEDENLLTLISNFDIPNKWKTVAVLYRGSQLPTAAAMSGWAHEEDSDVQVGGREWTMEVRQLCDFIGYPLTPHQRDQGESGRYHACHAEKQLVAFFVNKHLFLSKEVEKDVDIARLRLHEPSDEEYEQQEIERRHREKLSSLREVEPPVTINKGKILVCRPICEDCRSFLKHVNSTLHLELTIFHRCLDNGCKACRS